MIGYLFGIKMKKRIYIAYILILLFIFNTLGLNLNVSAATLNTSPNFSGKKPQDIPGNASVSDAEAIPSDAPKINAASAIVMDLDTGDILYEKNPDMEMYPASITKVLTCLIAIENGNVNDTITVSDNAMKNVEEGSSTIGLQAGESLSLRDALYGMMLNSGNDCALAISEYIGGSIEGFTDMMNKRSRELGCRNSHFVNPNGLQNENHYTTCYDMALIGRAAYQYPEFKKLVSTLAYTIPKTNKNEERNLWQENRLIYEGSGEYYYEFCTGGKTGYTDAALATLLSYAERDGKRLITVVMKCNPTDESFSDTIKLFEFCFNKYLIYRPLQEYGLNQANSTKSTLLSNYYGDLNHNLIKYSVDNSFSFYMRSFITDDDVKRQISYLPYPENGKIGKIDFIYEGKSVAETDIFADVPYLEASSTDAIGKKKAVPEKESEIIKWARIVIIVIILLIIFLLLIIIIVKVRRWSQDRRTRRSVKYFPKKRDPRLRENQEKQKATENKDSGKD